MNLSQDFVVVLLLLLRYLYQLIQLDFLLNNLSFKLLMQVLQVIILFNQFLPFRFEISLIYDMIIQFGKNLIKHPFLLVFFNSALT